MRSEHKKPAREWTDAEKQIVEAALRQGYSREAIATTLCAAGFRDRTASGVSGLIMRKRYKSGAPLTAAEFGAGVTRGSSRGPSPTSSGPQIEWTDAMDAVVRIGFRDGNTDKQIAAELVRFLGREIHYKTVAHRRYALDLRRKQGFDLPRDPSEKKKLGKLLPIIRDWSKKHRATDAAMPLFEAPATACRWPVGPDEKHLICGECRAEGSSYCEHHREVAVAGAFNVRKAMGWKAAS